MTASEIQSLTVVLPLPSEGLSPNDRVSRWDKSRAVRKYRRDAGYAAIHALDRRRPPRWGRAIVQPTFYFRERRHRDSDNLQGSLKAAFDGLVDAKILQDDRWLVPLPPKVEIDARDPRVELHVWRAEE